MVGAGIVGLALGREIALRRPGTRVVVFEKERRVALHQTGHNSGVVHAGIYYVPGSLKADLTVRGVALLREYCQDRGLPYRETGKLVMAVREDELDRMEHLYRRARNNHVPDLRKVTRDEIRELEPHAGGIAALHSPRTAITDYPAIAREFAGDITASGGEIRCGFPVTGITEVPGGVEVASGEQRLRTDRLILCAGLQSDAVARLARDRPEPRI
ncbi:FAD-dependent oxidoreductase, partial [Streptomyces sp. TRM76130]|nr:FAD-dependent oxidoreductase [Streptomyces sp. TRM76130]